MEHQILDRFVGAVRVVVPPAAVASARLPGGVVLGDRDADGPRLVKGRQDPLDEVDVGRHPELLAPGLPTRLKVHRGAGQKDRGIDGGAEASERGDEGLDRDAFRVLRVLGVDGLVREADEKHHDESERRSSDHLVHSSQEAVKTEVSRLSAKPSIRHRGMSRLSWLALLLGLGGGLALTSASTEGQVASGFRFEVVATSIPRPAQLALTASGRLVVLSHGWRGDAAAEIFWLDPRGALPVNASVAPRVVIPFAEGPRKTALGSLAVDSKSGDLFLGEENGNRIYRLAAARRLSPLAVGLNHLLGGSSLTLDREGRLR